HTENPTMPDSFAELRHELAVANRVLANEGIIDAFGHISVRNPKNPDRYFISRHRASELVEPSDILEMTLDSKPVVPTNVRLYSEMVIHGEIYKARPDVNSVCHHHAPAVLPFCATGVELVPLFHLGGTLGTKVPFWDSRDEFGDTNLLVRTPEEGASHARAFGPHYMLLLRRHGASLAGKSLRECVFRSIYTTRNAELQLRAMAIGTLGPLSPGEVEKCGGHNLGSRGVERAWEYWVTRLQKAEAMWAAAGLPRLKDLAAVARPQTAGLAPARRAVRRESRASRTGARKRRWFGRGNAPVTPPGGSSAAGGTGAGLRRGPRAAIRRRKHQGGKIHNSGRVAPDCRQKRFVPAPRAKHRGNTMQTKRTYQVQHWPGGQWNPEHNWRKIEAASEKEAAEKVCGLALTEHGTLATSRPRPHLRRSQTSQRHVVLCRGVVTRA